MRPGSRHRATQELDPDDWERTFAINVDSAFRVAGMVTGPMPRPDGAAS